MKRYIRSNRVPDMTERYPEGQRSVYDDYDYLPYDPVGATVADLAYSIKEDVEQGDYYNTISIIEDNQGVVFECHEVEDLLRSEYRNVPVKRFSWKDADITIIIPESMRHNAQRKGYIGASGGGTGKRTRYYLIDYPDRTPIVDPDTGARYSFSTKEEAESFIEENPYFKKKYPGISVESKIEYDVYNPNMR